MSVRLKKVCQLPLGAKFVLHSCFQSIPINRIIFFVVMCSPPQIRLWRREIVLQLFHSETKPMNERTNERTHPFQEILLKHFFLSCFYSSAGVLLSSVWRSVTNELLLKMFFLWNFKILYFFLFSSESPGCHLREIVRCASSKENQRWAKKKKS